jgi:hypothetical protein
MADPLSVSGAPPLRRVNSRFRPFGRASVALQGANAGGAAREMRRKMKKAEARVWLNRTSRLIYLIFPFGWRRGFSLA